MTVRQIVSEGKLRTEFQPIVNLSSCEAEAFEALTRTDDPAFSNPRDLFVRAELEGLAVDLEILCWTSALTSAAAQNEGRFPNACLFLNVLPDTLFVPRFIDNIRGILNRTGIPAEKVVIEVTEGSLIEDLGAFSGRLRAFRNAGFRIALDDAGAGHAGLQTMVAIEPDFVKIDRSLVSGCDQHPGRQAALEALVLFGQRLSTTLIAEGIETEAELRTVRTLQIPWGQGYLLGRPAPLASPPDTNVLGTPRHEIGLSRPSPSALPQTEEGTISALVRQCPRIARDVSVQVAVDLLSPGRNEAIVVVDEGKPWGVVERGPLIEILARPYGRDLLLHKHVGAVAETRILKIDVSTPLDDAARAAMARSSDTVYQHVIATRDGLLAGVVSVRQLIDAITDSRIERARHSNPLTGLPGNPAIETVLRERLRLREPIGVLHIDLDDFKAYNDVYGFHRGDEAIRTTAGVLDCVLGECGGPGAFLGHVGGDDFFAIVPADRVREVGQAMRAQFRACVGELYSQTDRKRGFVLAKSRDGELRQYPLMDITVAGTVVGSDRSRHYAQVLDELAKAKQFAKRSRAEVLAGSGGAR